MARYPAEYHRLHDRVRRVRGKASAHPCEHCGDQEARHEWATIHGHGGQDPYADYISLCRKCHVVYDDLAGAVSKAMTGRINGPHSVETKQKMSARQHAYWYSKTPDERSAELRSRRWKVVMPA
jgi:hypothetical protein